MALAAWPVAAPAAWLYIHVACSTLLVSLATKRHQPLMRRLANMRTTNSQQTNQSNRSIGHQKRQWQRTVQQNTRRLVRVERSNKNAPAATQANSSYQGMPVHDPLPRSAVPLVTVDIGPDGQPAVTLFQRQPVVTLPQTPLASVGVSSSGQVVSQAPVGTAQPTAALVLPPAVAPVAAAAPAVQSTVAGNTSQASAAAGTGSDSTSSEGSHPLSFVLAIAMCVSLLAGVGFYIFIVYW
eukprot:CAMPEP_0172835864 /NCGR_PEP_ID=MMETSP1075-20121228/26071_1 /TAXON_ID=2916 /ORGANISM="Ceratium fusus, Strain PA161109" /LENGTH=238 /DNA_ID=CAMNT_0013678987 /DNA_START=79 /DNA_END=792 /DNA_ORIENTATION=-